MKYFDIKRDNQIIDHGSFWCEVYLTGKPLDDMSPDQRYCIECYSLLKETKSPEIPETWTSDNQVFILGGKGYCVSPDGRTVCVGSVDDRGKPIEAVSDAPLTHCSTKSGVPKLDLMYFHSPKPSIPKLASKTGGILGTRNSRGRPRKKIPVDRIKELSGEGMVIRDIAGKLNIGYSTVSRVLLGQR